MPSRWPLLRQCWYRARVALTHAQVQRVCARSGGDCALPRQRLLIMSSTATCKIHPDHVAPARFEPPDTMPIAVGVTGSAWRPPVALRRPSQSLDGFGLTRVASGLRRHGVFVGTLKPLPGYLLWVEILRYLSMYMCAMAYGHIRIPTAPCLARTSFPLSVARPDRSVTPTA